jgi:hypothetical protein
MLGLGRYCLGLKDMDPQKVLQLGREVLEQSDQIHQEIQRQIALARLAIVLKVEESLKGWLS